MTKTDLINAAREKARLGKLSESEQGSDKFFYDLYLEDILEERDWLFAYGKSTKLTLTEPELDLGYEYVYVVGDTDIEDVIFVNNPNPRVFINFRKSIKYGFTSDPVTDSTVPPDSGFIFVNGLLHSSVPVTQIFYKRKPSPENMPASFQLFLILTLAEHLARSSKDKELKDVLRREKNEAHLRATRFESKLYRDPQLEELYQWIRTYRKQTNYRYN